MWPMAWQLLREDVSVALETQDGLIWIIIYEICVSYLCSALGKWLYMVLAVTIYSYEIIFERSQEYWILLFRL